jgi:hypothetical protein
LNLRFLRFSADGTYFESWTQLSRRWSVVQTPACPRTRTLVPPNPAQTPTFSILQLTKTAPPAAQPRGDTLQTADE